jgi:hypothetical protein
VAQQLRIGARAIGSTPPLHMRQWAEVRNDLSIAWRRASQTRVCHVKSRALTRIQSGSRRHDASSAGGSQAPGFGAAYFVAIRT